MRIVKLSDNEFASGEDVKKYFEEELRSRHPPGKFLVTKGRIARNTLDPGERLIFTYRGHVIYTAIAKTGREDNSDDRAKTHPYYIVVDLSTLQAADATYTALRQKYNVLSNAEIAGRGWNILPATQHSAALWKWLRN